jgi:hypothetical protein
LHGMAYYIFLKSLRSLEEFRKNPHVKIPPKSPSTNFPSLRKFKIQFLIQKSFFFTFGPATQPQPTSFFQPSRGPPPPSRSGPVGQNWSVFHRYRTGPLSELGRFGRLSLTGGPTLSVSPGSSSELVRFAKLVRSGHFARRPSHAHSAHSA